eukprot:m.49765 g.49765  ORF g.49765 m.49765 type:complete len:834 (-) comp6495_c0_seq2:1773-4274(-)
MLIPIKRVLPGLLVATVAFALGLAVGRSGTSAPVTALDKTLPAQPAAMPLGDDQALQGLLDRIVSLQRQYGGRASAAVSAQPGGQAPKQRSEIHSVHSEDSRPLKVAITDAAEFIAKALPEGRRGDDRPIRVCLVTSAVAGPTRSGGIGTAFHAMAMHLAAEHTLSGGPRFHVTILYAAHPYYGAHASMHWIEHFKQFNIRFIPLPEPRREIYGPKYVVRAYQIFEYLRARESEFDVLSYHDHMGNGYFLALAKRQGLAFNSTVLLAQCHSTVRWADELNYRPPKDHNTLAYYYMEQKALEWADARVSPSAYYLDWMRDAGYDLSQGRSFVVQNLMHPQPDDASNEALAPVVSRHFVFFARLEVRKGLMVFLDALDKLHAAAGASGSEVLPTHVSFIGPDVSIDGDRASAVVRRRAAKWKVSVLIEHSFNTAQALQFIRSNSAIAVLPTLGDNSPYVVMEIAGHRLPLITTSAGGGVELLSDLANTHVVVPPENAEALARAMLHGMTAGILPAKLAKSFSQNRATYISLIEALARGDQDGHGIGGHLAQGGREHLQHSDLQVMIGITSHNRPDSLLATVDTLIAQSYSAKLMNVVILDDASTHPGMLAALDDAHHRLEEATISHKAIVLKEHAFVANARNLLLAEAARANVDYLCFMDDDDLALPEMLETYMKVARSTDADLLTDLSDNYDVDSHGRPRLSHRSIAIGNAFAHNFFINNYGKANFCVRPELGLAIGGHQTGSRANSPYVDWGFLTRASLHGLKMELVPQVLYKYTKESSGSIWYGMRSQVDRYNGHAKILDDLTKALPPSYRDILLYCRYRLGIPKVAGDGPL